MVKSPSASERDMYDSPRSSSSSAFDDDDEHSDHQQSSKPNSSTLRVLARGNACLCCRRRKLKCDGTKPHCGPCSRGRRVTECVYEEAKVKTKTQALQTRIRELEARLKRMADKDRDTPSPFSRPSSSRRRSLSKPQIELSAAEQTVVEGSRSDSLLSSAAAFPTSFDPLSWTPSVPTVDTSFGQSDLLQSVASVITNTASDIWPASQSNAYGMSSWLDLVPSSDPASLFAFDGLGVPNIGVDGTVSPSNLGVISTSYAPPNSVSSNFSSSPSLTVTVPSLESSPPSSTWDDDVRLSALEITRQSDVQDVPPHIAQQLLRVFFQHRRQCMFQVNTERFMASLELPQLDRPHPALINAIYLLGCHFSPNSNVSQYENLFLARTRKGINNSLENADRLLNFLQASCLLAWYFFFKGRLLEGHYHASAAARFAMSCGLHLLKVKADGVEGTLTFYCPPAGTPDRSILPQPEDSIALAERINLFWSIFLADRTGSIGTGLSVVIKDQDIETPWPRRFEDFELNDLGRFDSNTLRSMYINGNSGAFVKAADNLHAIKCKALALNEQASRLASLLESDPGSVSHPDFWPQFDATDSAISRFIESLPPIRPMSTVAGQHWEYEDEEALDKNGRPSDISPSLVLAHTAAHGATIQLHRMFSQNDSGSYKRCLSAAKASMQIVREASPLSVKHMPMALGIVWTSVAEALAVEYERLRRCNYATQLKLMEDELHLLFNVMRSLRTIFPILTLRINKVPVFRGCSLEIDGVEAL